MGLELVYILSSSGWYSMILTVFFFLILIMSSVLILRFDFLITGDDNYYWIWVGMWLGLIDLFISKFYGLFDKILFVLILLCC